MIEAFHWGMMFGFIGGAAFVVMMIGVGMIIDGTGRSPPQPPPWQPPSNWMNR